MSPVFRYRPAGPYSLSMTAFRFTRWPEAVDRYDGTTYSRLLPVGRSSVLVEVRQLGAVAGSELEVRVTGISSRTAEARHAAVRLVETGLGAALDVRPFYRCFREDPLLAAPLRHFRGLRIAGTPSLWEAAVTAVLSQQINLVFAYDIRRELALAFGRRARLDGGTYVAFPSARRIAEQAESALRKFRLSSAKAATILRLAAAFACGTLDEQEIRSLSDEEAIERLTGIKGVGRWTAEIALLRGQGRADVFPGGDLGVVKYVAMQLLGQAARVKEVEMRQFAERWRPYRGLALVYAYAEIERRRNAGKRTGSVQTSALARRRKGVRRKGVRS